MRILNRKQFLQCPLGTVFFDYQSLGNTGALSIKTDDAGYMENDFCRVDVDVSGVGEPGAAEGNSGSDEAMDLQLRAEKGEAVTLHFDSGGRDGFFDEDAQFAVLDDDDVERLIRLLQNRKSQE